MPPSMTKSAPVTLPERRLARNTTRAATSVGVVKRPLAACAAALRQDVDAPVRGGRCGDECARTIRRGEVDLHDVERGSPRDQVGQRLGTFLGPGRGTP